MAPRLHVPTLVVAALLVASLGNVAQYGDIERDAGNWYRALRVKEGHTLAELEDNHFASTQARFGIYLDIREYAYGAEVVVPTGIDLNTEQLRGLAGAGSLVRPDGLLEVDGEVAAALDAATIDAGDNELIGGYRVVVGLDEQPTRLLLASGSDVTYLVSEQQLRAAGGEVPS